MFRILRHEYEILNPDKTFSYPYYITFFDGDTDWVDEGAAHYLHMSYWKYRTTLVEKFNACHYDNGRTFFYTKKDAKQALEYIQAIHIALKLAE